MRILSVISIALLFPVLVHAQLQTIKGTVSDATTGETLIGATILYGEGKGGVSDLDGQYKLSVPAGTYTVKVSYVGYIEQQQTVTTGNKPVTLNFKLKTMTLTEVEVVADVALTRETPVAFSTVKPKEIREELASQDIPMILNKTPGAYATQQGGGDGDARINIRGFSQRNLAVMIDGIPVNDMENGWVYWSNWFGLDAVTRSIQVQRGLGASKLALPSVGGTMNILTQSIETNLGGSIKQEVGSDGFLRTTLGVTTGQMKHGWGVTLSASYKQGKGWVDNTWTKGWFFYLRVDKKLGNHLLTFSAMGAPQEHAQRSYKKTIATFDKDYASKLGVDTTGLGPSFGIRYNPNWGYLNRWEYGSNGEKIYQSEPEKLSQAMNYYFKPQLSLRDFWRIHDKLYLSNILYASFGQGGGTGTATSDKFGSPGSSTPPLDPLTGQVQFQNYYNSNMEDTTGRSSGILRSGRNNHYWFGLLSTFNWEITGEWTLSGGLDLRTYRGEHYREVYDLLGGSFFLDNSNKNRSWSQKLYEEDKIFYNNDSKVRWGGLFVQAEFQRGGWTAFLNLTAALSAYQRIDYFRRKDITLDNISYTEVVGFGDVFYFNGSQNLIYSMGSGDTQYQSNDTTFVVKRVGSVRDTLYIVDATGYDINSPEARFTQTPWKVFPGFTVKGGVNYNIDERNNVYVNLGYLSRAPRFNNVFDTDNKEFLEIRNEIVQAFELGYSYYSKRIGLNLNGYLTNWMNKPLDSPIYATFEEDSYPVNINGIDAFHMGIELQFGWKIIPSLQWDQVASLGDWRWMSADTAYIYSEANTLIKKFYFNAKGVHVGDAAQFQLMESLRWEIIKRLYVSGSFTLFAKNYSNMDPVTLSPDYNPGYLDENGKPKDSWLMPIYYLVDLNAGYRFVFKNFKLDLRGTVLNLLDQKYISDAQNNDSYATSKKDFDAASAGVFFGLGRRFNFSITISY
ncbi:TonB-dependent receptor [Bacteroidota bacterium]